MMDCLLDDYLLLYLKKKDKEYLSSAILKIVNCGIDEKTAVELINLELDIIKFRKDISFPIIKNYFWLDKIDLFKKNENGHVFKKDINDYVMLRYDTDKSKISNYTLTLSELCAVYDEAWIICNKFKNQVPKNMFNECYNISKYESMKSWVIREFKTRIEEVYRTTNNIKEDYDHLILGKQIDNLYKEELKTLLSQRDYYKFIK